MTMIDQITPQNTNNNKKPVLIVAMSILAIIFLGLGGYLFLKQEDKPAMVDEIGIEDNQVVESEVDNNVTEYKQSLSQINKEFTRSLELVNLMTSDPKTFASEQTQKALDLEVNNIEVAISTLNSVEVPEKYTNDHENIITFIGQYKEALTLMNQSIGNKSLDQLSQSNKLISESTSNFNQIYLKIISE